MVTLKDKGIYAVDVASGAWLRIADAGPFDVVGNRVLTSSGTSVFSSALDGSGRRELYRVDGAEQITWFETASDGTSYVLLSTPLRDAAGTVSGAEVYGKLIGPDGAVRAGDLPVREVEWTRDGTVLVVVDHLGVRGLRASGATAWGPIRMPETIMQGGLRISPDGKFVLGRFDADRVHLLDVAAQEWRVTPITGDASFGPGGDVFGHPSPAGGTQPRLVRWNPSAAATTPFADSGYEPYWSPNGRFVVSQDLPASGPEPRDQHLSLRVRDASGKAFLTLTSPEHEFGRDTMFHSGGVVPVVLGPRWSGDGRILVVGLW